MLDNSISVKWRSFELRPEPVPTLDPERDYLTNAWRDHVYPLAEKMGMPLKKPSIQPRSRLAHEATKWADSFGRVEDFNLALFRFFLNILRILGI